MARQVTVESAKTYATEANCIKAVEKMGYPDDLRYTIFWNAEKRCFPVFLGTQCLQYGVHFHFPVVG